VRSYDDKMRRLGYVIGTVVGLVVGYAIFVLTSPVLGLWLVWEAWRRKNPRNVIFASFARK
jgi:hypothetical protein